MKHEHQQQSVSLLLPGWLGAKGLIKVSVIWRTQDNVYVGPEIVNVGVGKAFQIGQLSACRSDVSHEASILLDLYLKLSWCLRRSSMR